jgi:hypothetical protein
MPRVYGRRWWWLSSSRYDEANDGTEADGDAVAEDGIWLMALALRDDHTANAEASNKAEEKHHHVSEANIHVIPQGVE